MRKRGSPVVKSKTNLNFKSKISPISLRTSNLSPKKFDFSPNREGFDLYDNSFDSSPLVTKKKKKKTTVLSTSTSKKKFISTRSTNPPPCSDQIIPNLKIQVSSSTDSMKRDLDLSHSEILKEFEACDSRLSKRFKIQTQTCQQVVKEADKEHKKMSDGMTKSMDAIKASYAEFVKQSEATEARVCKTSIPELTKSLENSMESLRKCYGVSASASK